MPSAGQDRRGGTILLVDDDVHVRTVGSEMLELLGYKAMSAKDGREGVEMFRAHEAEIVLVILDLSMPEMSGDDVLREIRRTRGDARVVLSSGYDEMEVRTRFAGLGINGFLQKPYTFASFRGTIEQVLR